jgi:hypothetical protein
MSLVPELFDLGAFEPVDGSSLPTIDTPGGRFSLSARLEPRTSSDVLAVHLRVGTVDLFIWDDPGAQVEARVSHATLTLPDGRVTNAGVATWCVHTRRPLRLVELSCELRSDTQGKPTSETLQELESLAWQVNGVDLSLGTPDAEALVPFARDKAPFPKRWIAAWGDKGRIPRAEYTARGVRVTLPSLTVGEFAQTHFVVMRPEHAASGATWFFLDQLPRVLFRHHEPAV